MRTRESALYLAVAPGTLEKWRKRGIGPAYVRLPQAIGSNGIDKRSGVVAYRREDLDDFVMAHRIQAGRLPRPVRGRLPGNKNRPSQTG